MRSRVALILALCVASVLGAAGARADQPPAGATPGATAPAAPAATASLGGVSLGDSAAVVLSRFGLHPPGWARSQSADAVGEMRVFPMSGQHASMSLLFDKTIEMIGVKANDADAQVSDSYGVKLGSTLTELIQLRGAPMDVRGDSIYIFQASDAIRWEYHLNEGKVEAIIVTDCGIPHMCSPLPS